MIKKILIGLAIVLSVSVICYYTFFNAYERYKIEKQVFGYFEEVIEDEPQPTNLDDTPLSKKYWYRGKFE